MPLQHDLHLLASPCLLYLTVFQHYCLFLDMNSLVCLCCAGLNPTKRNFDFPLLTTPSKCWLFRPFLISESELWLLVRLLEAIGLQMLIDCALVSLVVWLS